MFFFILRYILLIISEYMYKELVQVHEYCDYSSANMVIFAVMLQPLLIIHHKDTLTLHVSYIHMETSTYHNELFLPVITFTADLIV